MLDTAAQHLCAGERPLPRDAQPLALGACDLGPGLHERYLVCEKTDGVWERLLGVPGAPDQWWAVDRRGRVRELAEPPGDTSGGVTLVDAETVGSAPPRVFAAHWVAGRDTRDLPTLEGLQAAAAAGLSVKRMRPVSEARELVGRMDAAGGGGHVLGDDPVDGLIFTPRESATAGVLKWKFTHTVDLLVDPAGSLLCGGPGGPLTLHGRAPPGTAPGVYEFDLDPETAQWRLLKPRPDKDRPNYVKVVVHTLEIMAQGVTLDRIADAGGGKNVPSS